METIGGEMEIEAQPLTRENFVSFGQVIQKDGARNYLINEDQCTRFHNLAQVEYDNVSTNPIINIFSSNPRQLPLEVSMVERHPKGSQAFYPLSDNPFLIVVCRDDNNVPCAPEAFITSSGQGINFSRNVWHGVLTPLVEYSDFLVVDLGGEEENLEEYFFEHPFSVIAPSML